MKKKTIANLVMAAVILVIAAAGVLTVGHIRGWFDAADGNAAVLTQLRGVITMERDGVAYDPENETVLRRGDRITCGSGATAVIRIGVSELTLGENTEVVIEDAAAENFSATVAGGEVFIHASDPISLSFDGKTVVFDSSVAALSVRSGAQSVSILAGTVDGASSGQIIDWVGGTRSVGDLKLASLNDFTIEQIRKANEHLFLCFTNAQLDALMAQREAELQQTEPLETQPEETTAPTEPVTEPTEEAAQLPTEGVEQPTEKPEPPKPTEPVTEPTDPPATQPPATEASTEPRTTCTITIRCDTILNNMDNLDPAKAGFVPGSGCILSTRTVEFTANETVFDVLKRVCAAYGIQIEYSWTPMYDSYYIEGINNLYEFDCGSESGWMYKVNGWFPNYGCSSYTLKDGDSIVWCYTCTGLGADVGA